MMQRIKSFLGIKQNIGNTENNTINESPASTISSQDNETPEASGVVTPSELTQTQNDDLGEMQFKSLRSYIDYYSKNPFKVTVNFEKNDVHKTDDTTKNTAVQKEASNDVDKYQKLDRDCYSCKFIAVGVCYGLTGYTAYMIKRDYTKRITFKTVGAMVQCGILVTILFGLGTCRLFDIQLFSKESDHWLMDALTLNKQTSEDEET